MLEDPLLVRAVVIMEDREVRSTTAVHLTAGQRNVIDIYEGTRSRTETASLDWIKPQVRERGTQRIRKPGL